MSEALRFRSVEFGYREASVLVDLDLAIDTGEMVAVLGPNGTGKTTLVRLASGQLAPRAGSIRLAGRELREQTAVERARSVAVVPQETHLAFNYTVEEVVMMGRAPHQGMLGITRTVDRETVVLAMERTGVTHLARRGFARLSGGERQRVVIARALAQEPRVLLLDEPTSFLDLRHRLIVYALLERLSREVGLTLVVVSHDINLVARHCPRLVLLHRGRVHADGTPEAVLTPARLREVYGVEAEVRPDPVNGRPYVVGLRAP